MRRISILFGLTILILCASPLPVSATDYLCESVDGSFYTFGGYYEDFNFDLSDCMAAHSVDPALNNFSVKVNIDTSFGETISFAWPPTPNQSGDTLSHGENIIDFRGRNLTIRMEFPGWEGSYPAKFDVSLTAEPVSCDPADIDSTIPIRPTYKHYSDLVFAFAPSLHADGSTPINLVTGDEIVVHGGVTFDDSGALLDGSTGYFRLPTDLNLESVRTLVIRAMRDDFSLFNGHGHRYLFDKRPDKNQYIWHRGSDQIMSISPDGGFVNVGTNSDFVEGVDFEYIFNGTANYVNGVEVSSQTTARSFDMSNGYLAGPNWGRDLTWPGYIYEVLAFSTALTPADFPTEFDSNLYNCGAKTIPPETSETIPSFAPIEGYFVSYLSTQDTQIITSTEGVPIAEMSCNINGGGSLCQSFDGDTVLTTTRLADLCGLPDDKAGYNLTLSPTCNGSQFRNGSIQNLSSSESDSCTSASPDCLLFAEPSDLVRVVIDLDNDEAGADSELRYQPIDNNQPSSFTGELRSVPGTRYAISMTSSAGEIFSGVIGLASLGAIIFYVRNRYARGGRVG